ncbi:hypothetical protein DMENIID0001_037800 [Sergentomyia squamirostris]
MTCDEPKLVGIKVGFPKHMCHLCLWDSRDRKHHYVLKEWPKRLDYSKVIEFLQEKMEGFAGPENIMTDLEPASVAAFRKFYLGVTQSGCFFHFCQALYAKMKVNYVLLK